MTYLGNGSLLLCGVSIVSTTVTLAGWNSPDGQPALENVHYNNVLQLSAGGPARSGTFFIDVKVLALFPNS